MKGRANAGPEDYKKCDFATVSKLANKGDAQAQYNLSVMYFHGFGVREDFNKSVKWMTISAKQGNFDAQISLAAWHSANENYEDAMKWARLAAGQGSAEAQALIGEMYYNGSGVKQDYKEAYRWYRLAADHGEAFAQNNLGMMYKDGQGVIPSKIIAYALFYVSAASDSSDENKASENRDQLKPFMSKKEIQTGRDLSREMSKPGNFLIALDSYVKNTKSE
jgi:TPR repeat protein